MSRKEVPANETFPYLTLPACGRHHTTVSPGRGGRSAVRNVIEGLRRLSWQRKLVLVLLLLVIAATWAAACLLFITSLSI